MSASEHSPIEPSTPDQPIAEPSSPASSHAEPSTETGASESTETIGSADTETEDSTAASDSGNEAGNGTVEGDRTPAEDASPAETATVSLAQADDADSVAQTDDADGVAQADQTDQAGETAQADQTDRAGETASADQTAAAPAPTPPRVPAPPRVPRPPRMPAAPRAVATPAAPAPAFPASDPSEWGRVTEDGTVEVREGDAWRVVGQYPDGTPAEALAYFGRKFDDLAFKVHTLEQRHQAGGAAAADLVAQAKHLVGEVTDAAAVGDLASLRARLDALTDSLAEATAAEAQQARELVDRAIAERTELVENMEAIAARDLSNVQWKQVTAEVTGLFDAWQAQQQSGPRLPKSTSQQLWKRFRDARAVVDKARRAFYAELDETHKAARDRKSRLIERAEALAAKGVDGIPAYRTLLDEWKAAGRAGRKADDALWARFKAAGDALYAARAEQTAAEEADSAPKIAAREALLDEAKAVADEPDIKRARALLTRIQKQWDEVGRIFPREKERAQDDRLRVIEQALKAREDVDWKRNNPETKARANDMSQQLLDAIEKLEAEKAAAEKAGDAKAAKAAAEALEARRAWLSALKG